MKKILAMIIIGSLLCISMLSLSQPQSKAGSGGVQEYWVPLVFPQGWPGNDFFSTVNIFALEDSSITIDGGSPVSILAYQSYTYYNPHAGTHVIVETGRVMAFYNWMVNDYGIWDDCPLGYTILPASRLGSSYLIPIEGTVSVVATQPSTIVSRSGSPTPVTLANPGDSLQFVSADGGWIEADKPIGVAVGHYDSVTKGDSYAYTPLPKDLIGFSYHFGMRVPMDPYFPNQVDLSKIGIMATEQGATISINGVAQPPLPARGVYIINKPTDDTKITSDKSISVAYLQRVQHSDPWNGELRSTSYAYSLVPKTLYGKTYLDTGQLTHLITETDASVQVGSNPPQQYSPGVYDLGTIPAGTLISSDVPAALEEIGVSTWAGVKYHAQGPGFEVFPIEFYVSGVPSIESVILNRNPAITTHWAFQLSALPAEYSATMPGLGVWAAVKISNPTGEEFNGRLRVFFKDPRGNEEEHFQFAGNAIYVTVPAASSITKTVPIYGTGLYGGDTGMYTIRFVLGKGMWYDWTTLDEKTTQLLVTPNNPIDGPKHHGITIPISELLTAKKPSITDLALEALNLALLLAQAKGSTHVDASGVHCRDPEFINDILPGAVATTDLSLISHALDTSTFLKANSHKIATNTYTLSFKTFLNPTTIDTDNGEYTFDPSYDRIRLIVNFPAGVVVTDKGDALEAFTDANGGTTVFWIDNFCDKLFNGVSSKTHQITVQVIGGATYSVQAHAYFEIGPLGQEPKSSVFPITDYNKWNSDPANVYWIEMTTKEDSLSLKGK